MNFMGSIYNLNDFKNSKYHKSSKIVFCLAFLKNLLRQSNFVVIYATMATPQLTEKPRLTT